MDDLPHVVTHYAIRNWEKFQHYNPAKRTPPPWIKLHASILDDREVAGLSLAVVGLLTLCWALASEKNGTIPGDLDELRFRLRRPKLQQSEVDGLVGAGFLIAHVEADARHRLEDARHVLDACPSRARAHSASASSSLLKKEIETRKETDTTSEEESGSVDVPEEWGEVAAALQSSRWLDRPALYDWTWWESLGRAYGEVDPVRQIARMDEWCGRTERNVKKSESRKNWKNFVANWFSKEVG